MASTNPIDASTLRHLALAFVKSYDDWSIDSIMAHRAPNCIHQILPASLSRQPMNNDAYREHFPELASRYRDFHITVHDVIADPAAYKVVLLTIATAETEIGPYANEYVIVLHLNKEGKVEKILEFVDSAYTKAFRGRLLNHQKSSTS